MAMAKLGQGYVEAIVSRVDAIKDHDCYKIRMDLFVEREQMVDMDRLFGKRIPGTILLAPSPVRPASMSPIPPWGETGPEAVMPLTRAQHIVETVLKEKAEQKQEVRSDDPNFASW